MLLQDFNKKERHNIGVKVPFHIIESDRIIQLSLAEITQPININKSAMSFSSIHFVFIFLPLVLLLYYVIPNRKWKVFLLTIASFVFFYWADPSHIGLLLIFVILNYIYGRLLGVVHEKQKKLTSRILVWIAVGMDLLILVFYKYLGFIGDTFFAVAKIELGIKTQLLPLGISYFTFSGISYLLDVYHGVEKPEKNLFRFTSFLVMFPKLLQGPITRYQQVRKDLENPGFDLDETVIGVRRFIMGLAKKVLFADTIAVVAKRVLDMDPEKIGAGVAWYGMIAFALQIYFDFAGYTDMAIGLGKMFGFTLPENFNFPYMSRSITDFWRRWHMTLTAWFRNYIFIPLEFARKRQTFLRQQSNILIVFALTGLWHGASWNFVIWGAYFGLILAIEASGFGKLLKKIPVFLQRIYALGLIIVGWIFFYQTNVMGWGPFFKALFGKNGWTGFENMRTLNILGYMPIIILGILFSTPLLNQIETRLEKRSKTVRMVMDGGYILVFVLVICYLLSNGFTSFLYTRF